MIESPKVVNMDALQSDDLSSNTVEMFSFSFVPKVQRGRDWFRIFQGISNLQPISYYNQYECIILD